MDQELKTYLDGLKAYLDVKFGSIDEQIDARFKQIDDRFKQIDARFEQIDARFEQIDEKFKQVDQRIIAVEARLLHLISENSQSLQREMATLSGTVTESNRRLDRQGALIQTGARFSARMTRWSENIDKSLESQNKRIRFIEEPPR